MTHPWKDDQEKVNYRFYRYPFSFDIDGKVRPKVALPLSESLYWQRWTKDFVLYYDTNATTHLDSVSKDETPHL